MHTDPAGPGHDVVFRKLECSTPAVPQHLKADE